MPSMRIVSGLWLWAYWTLVPSAPLIRRMPKREANGACIRKRRGKWVVDYRDASDTRRCQPTRPTVDLNITLAQIRRGVTGLRQGYRQTPVRILHAALRAMLNSAVDDGVILANPAEKPGRQLRLVASAGARQEQIKAMTKTQLVNFLDCSLREAPAYHPLFLLLA